MNVTPLLVASTLLVTAACSGDPSSPDPVANDGRLQVVPGIAALAAVDVVVDGEVKLRNAAYGVPSSVIALPQGAHVVRIVPANGAAAPGGTPVTLRANDTTRVVAIGTATAINTVALGDTGAAPVPGKGKLRVTHLATNAPPIDVYRSQPDFPAFTRLMFPFPYQASSSFVESTPGNWVIRVTPKDGTQVLAESGPIRVDALWVRTVLLLDAPDGGIRITALGDS
jgi:hypothetical protein